MKPRSNPRIAKLIPRIAKLLQQLRKAKQDSKVQLRENRLLRISTASLQRQINELSDDLKKERTLCLSTCAELESAKEKIRLQHAAALQCGPLNQTNVIDVAGELIRMSLFIDPSLDKPENLNLTAKDCLSIIRDALEIRVSPYQCYWRDKFREAEQKYKESAMYWVELRSKVFDALGGWNVEKNELAQLRRDVKYWREEAPVVAAAGELQSRNVKLRLALERIIELGKGMPDEAEEVRIAKEALGTHGA